jgi:heptosyltransferase-2
MSAKILVLCLPGLGDTILFTPCFRIIKERNPEARIIALTMFESSKQIIEDNPYVDVVLRWKFLSEPRIRSIKFLLNLRNMKFDMSVTAFPAYRREYSIISFLAGAKERIGHKFKSGYFTQFTFLYTKTVQVEYSAHNVENNLNLIEAMDQKKNARLDVRISMCDEKFAELFLNNLGLSPDDFIIGMHPGSFERGKGKRWPIEKFIDLSETLNKEYNAKTLIFFGPSEKDLINKISRENSIAKNLIIVKDLTIKKVAALIKRCRLFVSNDSGLMHLAAAMRVPIVAIYGATDPNLNHPWNVEHEIVRKKLPCSPCYYYTNATNLNNMLFTCRNHQKFECIKSVTVEDVIKAIKRLAEKRIE